jgi:hypothetical protein
VNKLLIAALAAVLVAGASSMWACAPAKSRAPEKATEEKPYDLESEGEIPPADENAPAEADVEEIPLETEDVEAENVEAPKDTTKNDKSGAGPAGVPGRDGSIAVPVFRVQILATSSETSAREAKKRVEDRLGFPVYVTRIDGMYKVRVGDCSTRAEAEKVRERCRGAGYADAWIVTDVLRGP